MRTPSLLAVLAFSSATLTSASAADATLKRLDTRFKTAVHPFLETYCVSCHGKEKAEAELDLTAYSSVADVLKDGPRWDLVLERLESEEMPPSKAKKHPAPGVRSEAVDWFQALRKYEIQRHAGDPGIVLARRLSNAEFNYTIRDLTGVDLKPTREFPADPSNTAGFDNSGESLTMSPSLLKKYLQAAREVANHLFLKPEGFAFAAHPMLAETDRDKYAVHQIIDFYHRQNTDYAAYFRAAWSFKHRGALGKPKATLADFAAANRVSAKYLATIWATLETEKADLGPLVKLHALWRELPAPRPNETAVAQKGFEQMRDYIVKVRAKVEPRFLNITAGKIAANGQGRGNNAQGVNSGSQVMMIWKNVQYATHRMKFDPVQLQVEGEAPVPPLDVANESGAGGEFGPGRTVPLINQPGDPDLAVPEGQRARYEAAWAKFCAVFPDKFYMEERGRNYFNTKIDRGRYLSAGFHSNMGYFRDDQPLYELILDDQQRKELDALWINMDFIASTTSRMYVEFNPGRRQGRGAAAEAAVPEVAAIELPATPVSSAQALEITSEAKIMQTFDRFLAQAEGGDPRGTQAIKDYFPWINATLRATEKAKLDAEPSHLKALLEFAGRAYRRPLTKEDKDDLLSFYRVARDRDKLDHEAAMRESIVSVLMAPDLAYRIDLAQTTTGIHRLSDYDLASRLSYFLWASMPDDELLAHAKAGDLHEPKVITAQARRMLKDPRARALAVEFGGNWLDFRRFEGIGTVDVERFPAFTSELRQAMFEEPIRFTLDVIQANRSVLDFLYAKDTFVNPVLAKHYGMPAMTGRADEWVRVADADRYERGGILPMAVFLTKNAPGLRTSPVKRGNWVVKNVLGERIPPPPPNVPELPQDEAKLDLPLRDMLARHRADPNCAACHARFDSFGLVFEGFGPVGDRREKDLGGRAVDTHASFAGGAEVAGLEGLRQHIRDKRQTDFVNNLSSKLLVYALGRSLMLSDDPLIQDMRRKVTTDSYRFQTLVDSIVTSPQFLNKRGRDDFAQR
ncbi:MAG: DUF1592 domain-containing protein [Opitutaceae bacterium]